MGKRKSPRATKKKADPVNEVDTGPSKSKYAKKNTTGKKEPPVPSAEKQSSIPAKPTDNNKAVMPSDKRLGFEFFDQPCIDLSKALLGKYLVRKLDSGKVLKGKIVETEAYLGGEDKGAHSYNGKRTAKNEAMYMDPGTGYVYHIYGLYTCINISCRGDGAAVLIRALDPVEGIPEMKGFRGAKRKDGGEGLKDKELCSGPSKLTQALSISKKDGDQKDLNTYDRIWVEEGEAMEADVIVTCARIGIDYAEEWAKKPLRFYVKGNKSISVRDKAAEAGEVVDTPETVIDNTKTTEKKARTPRKKESEERSQHDNKKAKKSNSSSSSANSIETLLDSSICDKSTHSILEHPTPGQRLHRDFFQQPCLSLAKNLLGKVLVRKTDDGEILKGFIIETEAYLGTQDGCCHSYSGKATKKTAAMFMSPGTAYVYHVYYSYFCFNISSSGTGAVVLLRALEPIAGHDAMRTARARGRYDRGAGVTDIQLCNGPSKLCSAMKINHKIFNESDLTVDTSLWLEEGIHVPPERIVTSTRIGLKKVAEEWKMKPWRFYVLDNKCVSVRDKTAEQRYR